MENQTKKRVTLHNVSKQFQIGMGKSDSILSRLVNVFSQKNAQNKQVGVSGISFEGHSGETIGIIGKNGSGKSTLLRLVAGIYKQNRGEIKKEGNVMYVSGFQHSIRARLTVRENIFFAFSVLGLSGSEAKKNLNAIIDFAELREYTNAKVHQLSTGMLSRLNFSIFIHAFELRSPDILLLDEVISAGVDLHFKQKVELKMIELAGRGVVVMLASHLLGDLEKYCSRIIWIDNGSIVFDGEASRAINLYRSSFK